MTEPRQPITGNVPTGAVAAVGIVLLAVAAAILLLGGPPPAGWTVTGAAVFTLGQAAGLSAARRDARAAGGAFLVHHANGRWEVLPDPDAYPPNAHHIARAIAAHLERATPAPQDDRRQARRPPGRWLTFPSDEEPRR